MASIPNLNFAKWSQGTENEKAEFVKELGAAYTDIGFITIENHGFGDRGTRRISITKRLHSFGLEKSIKSCLRNRGSRWSTRLHFLW